MTPRIETTPETPLRFVVPPKALLLSIAIVALIGLFGCSQRNKTKQDQDTDQKTVTPTKTEQNQAGQGQYVKLQWCQAPGDGTYSPYVSESNIPGMPTSQPCQEELLATVSANGTSGNGSAIGRSKMGFLQINNFTITGTATPTATGSTTGTGSATQTPSANQTVYPTQHIQPETSASVPIAMAAPGGSNSQQSTATGPGAQGNATPSQTNQNPANYTSVKVPAEQLKQALDFLAALKQQQDAANGTGTATPGGTTNPTDALLKPALPPTNP